MIPDHSVFSLTPGLDKEQKLKEIPKNTPQRDPTMIRQYYVIPYQNCQRLPERDFTYSVYVPGTCT